MKGIKFEGYKGTWSGITSLDIEDMNGEVKTIKVFESDIYGDDAPYLYTDGELNVLPQLEDYQMIKDIESDMKNRSWIEVLED